MHKQLYTNNVPIAEASIEASSFLRMVCLRPLQESIDLLAVAYIHVRAKKSVDLSIANIILAHVKSIIGRLATEVVYT